MVAHNIADTQFLLAAMARRRLFFQEDLLMMFLTLGLHVMPPDKVEEEPCFVVAALIGRAQAQDFMRNGESTKKPYFPVPIGFRRLEGTHKRQPSCRNRSGSPQWCGSRGTGKAQSAKASSMVLILVLLSHRHAAPVEVTGNQVHIFVQHHCTICKDELFSYATFLSVNVTNV